jgi:Fic family protein
VRDAAWPAHGFETLPWSQSKRGGTREDRMFNRVEASIPPFIADLGFTPGPGLVREMEDALAEIAAADAESAGHSRALSQFMVRGESVASSKIERIDADALEYARALAGSRANASATSMVAAARALSEMVTAAGADGIRLDGLLTAHRALMADDLFEAEYAGRVRDVQNWIGGSDYSPRGALFVPPAPGRVSALLADLVAYLGRRDVPKLLQVAIAHAQFESIHPFTDGNGRIGRALINASLRTQGATAESIAPIASGILARRDEYFVALGAYRAGDVEPIVELITRSAYVGAEQSRVTIARLKELPERWASEITARRGSTPHVLLGLFHDNPVLTSADIERLSPAGATQTNNAISRLEEAGIIQEITGRLRDRAWVAGEMTAELDDLDVRIRASMNPGVAVERRDSGLG